MGTNRYENKVSVVTGAGSGIGAAIVRALASHGATVVAADVDGSRAEAVAAGLGEQVAARTVDVTDAKAVQTLVEDTVDRHGHLDLLFNNAGIGLAGEVRDLDLDDWQRCLQVNLWGVIHGVRAAWPVMVEQGSGHIVNTSSGAGLLPRPGMVPYATAKHAVVGLSTSLRAEGAMYGVRVSAVCPGYVATRIIDSTTYRNVDAARLTDNVPIKPVSATDCAHTVLRGVARNRAIIPVSKVTWLEWWMYRLSPSLAGRVSRLRAKAFADARGPAAPR